MNTFFAICLSFPILGILMSCFPRSWWSMLLHPHPSSAYVALLFFVLVLVSSVLGELSRHAIASAWRQFAKSWFGLRRHSTAGTR